MAANNGTATTTNSKPVIGYSGTVIFPIFFGLGPAVTVSYVPGQNLRCIAPGVGASVGRTFSAGPILGNSGSIKGTLEGARRVALVTAGAPHERFLLVWGGQTAWGEILGEEGGLRYTAALCPATLRESPEAERLSPRPGGVVATYTYKAKRGQPELRDFWRPGNRGKLGDRRTFSCALCPAQHGD